MTIMLVDFDGCPQEVGAGRRMDAHAAPPTEGTAHVVGLAVGTVPADHDLGLQRRVVI